MHLTLLIKIFGAILVLAYFLICAVIVVEVGEKRKLLGGLLAIAFFTVYVVTQVFYHNSMATVYKYSEKGRWVKTDWLFSFRDDDNIKHKIPSGIYIYGGKEGTSGFELIRYPVIYTSHPELIGEPVENFEYSLFRVKGGELKRCGDTESIFKDTPEHYYFASDTSVEFKTLWEVREAADTAKITSYYRKLTIKKMTQ